MYVKVDAEVAPTVHVGAGKLDSHQKQCQAYHSQPRVFLHDGIRYAVRKAIYQMKQVTLMALAAPVWDTAEQRPE
ncbi:hypothetical protein RvY_12430 [Ramazzottius varieornatus]|uniref:Uncharacterized protein n=1 Tax=Ramazzottius varieornatus TaxID=947166 RepID=A0A1D1VNP0_RAMVA|nr:hypothetical protein RvY_12430 [Ramazzottius varieornatus]